MRSMAEPGPEGPSTREMGQVEKERAQAVQFSNRAFLIAVVVIAALVAAVILLLR